MQDTLYVGVDAHKKRSHVAVMDRGGTQPTSYRVMMDIIDRGPERLDVGNVAIVPGSLLPETEGCFARSFANHQAIEPWIAVFDHCLFYPKRHGSLDGKQKSCDSSPWV